MRQITLQTPRSVQDRQEVPQTLELRFPGAAHREAAVPLQRMDVHGDAKIHLQPVEHPQWNRMPEGSSDPMGRSH